MSRIRAKHTKPERKVRQFLHRRGFRFRLHQSKLPGRPDLVFPKYRVALLYTDAFGIFAGGAVEAAFQNQTERFG